MPINRELNTEILVRMPVDLKTALIERAKEQNIGYAQLIRDAIASYLELDKSKATMIGPALRYARENPTRGELKVRRQAQELMRRLAMRNPGLLQAIIAESKESFE